MLGSYWSWIVDSGLWGWDYEIWILSWMDEALRVGGLEIAQE